jgi:hypothetical protein
VAKGVLLGEPAAQRPQVYLRQRVDAQPIEVGEQIEQIGAVGAYGVPGKIPLGPEMAEVLRQQRLELGRHLTLGHVNTLSYASTHSKLATR